MSLASLAIQTEAWLQEELGGQQAVLAALERVDAAARGGAATELAQAGCELESRLALAAPRDARRRALLGRLASALGVPADALNLTKASARLAAEHVETHRLDRLRTELREVVAAVLKLGRRLAAIARYHRGLEEELQRLLRDGSPVPGGEHVVDARA